MVPTEKSGHRAGGETVVANSGSLLDCLAERVRTQPDSTALIGDGEHVTYAELGSMALAAHARIEALRLPPGPVAVHAVKSTRTVALIIACMLARRPFLLPSAELGATTLETLLAQAGCADVLTADPVGDIPGQRVHHVDCVSPTDRAGADQGAPADGDITFMLTTSGSTGLPKIVPLHAGAVDRFTDWAAQRFDIRPGTVVLNYAPLNFDLCLLDIWAVLKAGGTSVLVPQERATNGRYLAELVRSNRVEVVQSVPMLYRLLADGSGRTPFSSVRRVIVTGDKIQPRLLGELPTLFPRAGIYNLYGCTETNDSFLFEVGGRFHSESDRAAELPIGQPLPGVDAVVVDEDGAVLEGPGTGELLVHTPFQTTGYLVPVPGPDRFVTLGQHGAGENPESEGRRYFRSGDLVRRDDRGVFTLLGRNDFQVKVRGTRVNLEEIEHVFLDHGLVAEAAVIGVPDDVAGLRIHAVVRGTGPGSVDGLALREHCRLRLPRAAIPATIRVVDDPLPTTSTGKIDRQAIGRYLLNRT
jgi:acyl-coenzyme A synthetase/AMP-(fatty) acid ligase